MLIAHRGGDAGAFDRLVTLVNPELHRLACVQLGAVARILYSTPAASVTTRISSWSLN